MSDTKSRKRIFDPQFGQFIREAREKVFPTLSLRKFAKALGISPQYESKIELGKVPPPSMEIVLMLASKLRIDPRLLLIMAGYVDKENTPESWFPRIQEVVNTGITKLLKERLIQDESINTESKVEKAYAEAISIVLERVLLEKGFVKLREDILEEFGKRLNNKDAYTIDDANSLRYSGNKNDDENERR